MRRRLTTALLGFCLLPACPTPIAVDAGPDAPGPDAFSSDAFIARTDANSDANAPLATLTMNDVSVLWPMPTSGLTSDFISVTAEGAHGPLLPGSAYVPIPQLVAFGAVAIGRLRVVAMRIDPCFRATTTGTCEPMVRLVAQPTSGPDGTSTGFADAAIHLHYPMSDAELRAFANEVAAARHGMFQSAPLSVHPLLAAEGLTGTFANTLRTLILEHLGADRLSRITFTTRTNSRAAQWQFGRVDRVGSRFVRVDLEPVLGTPDLQTLTAGAAGGYAVDPESLAPDALTDLYDQSSTYLDVPVASRQALLDRAYAVLNPERHTAESIDCSSCHIAGHIARDASDAWPTLTPTTRFSSTHALDTPTAPGQRDRIRAFGYFDQAPQVNQRTINETAATLEALSH